MTKKDEIKEKLIKALKSEMKLVKEALVDGNLVGDIEITRFDIISPQILSPEDIDADDFEKAEEIGFSKISVMLKEKLNDNLTHEHNSYCNGSAKINYIENDFTIDLNISNIYTR